MLSYLAHNWVIKKSTTAPSTSRKDGEIGSSVTCFKPCPAPLTFIRVTSRHGDYYPVDKIDLIWPEIMNNICINVATLRVTIKDKQVERVFLELTGDKEFDITYYLYEQDIKAIAYKIYNAIHGK